MKELIYIQKELKAPKGQYNNFGKYKYRSAEDILEAVKPLLNAQGCYITISDEIVELGGASEVNRYEKIDANKGITEKTETQSIGRIYIKATVTIVNSEAEKVSVSAYAREEFTKKGMDGAQITGSASSYARKYALNGMFAIDDTKDPDTRDNTTPPYKPPVQRAPAQRAPVQKAPTADELEKIKNDAKMAVTISKDRAELIKVWNAYPQFKTAEWFKNLVAKKGKTFEEQEK